MQDDLIRVQQIEPNMPAAKAGLKVGDRIVRWVACLCIPWMRFWPSCSRMMAVLSILLSSEPARRSHSLSLLSSRMRGWPQALSHRLCSQLAPLSDTANAPSGGDASVHPFQLAELRPDPRVLQRMATRRLAMQNLTGPIGIARQTGLAVEEPGWQPIIGLMAIISLNLGIFNLLPFPFWMGASSSCSYRGDPAPRSQSGVQRAHLPGCFLSPCSSFCLVMFNDISKLPLFGKLKP